MEQQYTRRNTDLRSVCFHVFVGFIFFVTLFAPFNVCIAGDWPTYQHDNERSGVTDEQLNPPLELDWVYQARHAPRPAWPNPAKHDYWHYKYNLKPRVTFDKAFQVVAADGSVYFSSSADDKVYCLDASTGGERWSFFTEGPVRLAPTIGNDKLYVGSDDGWVYCLNTKNGVLLWKYKPTERQHRIPGNGRMISLWPVRSGVLIHNDIALFCAGLFPSQGVYIVTLNAKDGTEQSKKKIDISSQGYLVVKDGKKVFTPTGRAEPAPVYPLTSQTTEKSPPAKPDGYPYSLIRAGDTVFAGGDDKVGAFNADSGEELWKAKVKGKVYGLAVADGRLFASTDKGMIYCFSKKTGAKTRFVSPANNLIPYPENKLTAVYANTAKQIVQQTGIRKGYCLVLGCNKGQLAYELAKLTDLKIIGVEQDADKVAEARKTLDEAGLYGRVVVHHGPLSKLPYSKYLFNLIVSDETISTGKLPTAADEVFRLLRPCGGVAYIGQPPTTGEKLRQSDIQNWTKEAPADRWKIVQDNGLWLTSKRGPLPGSGWWTHQYADAGNSSCSSDKLIQKDLQLQWFGRPGPYDMFDRHSRPHAPLSANGRLFIPADQSIYGLDAYNGTILWKTDVPQLQTRVNLPRDSGYMAVDNDYLYVAVKDKCRRFAADSGKHVFSYNLPDVPQKQAYDWGYLSCKDDLIFGSCVRKGSFYTDAKGPWYDGNSSLTDWENAKVCSDHVFAADKETGKVKWDYEGLIINSTIAVGADRIYFVENREKGIAKNTNFRLRRIGVELLWEKLFLVALNARTGEKVWETPVEFVKGKNTFYLSYADETVVVVSSPFKNYQIYAFNATDGTLLWQQSSDYRGDRNTFNHGGHLQHPVVMGDVIYQDPHEFNLRTGTQGSLVLTRDGHGCGSLSGANGYLFGRGSNPCLYDLSRGGETTRLTHISRVGCWINIIPAGGLVLIPEASSGCTCEFPVQTSMAFVSKEPSG